MRALMIVFLAFALATGCSVLTSVGEEPGNRLAVQYATLKVLESGEVAPAKLTALIEKAKDYVETGAEVTVARLADEARAKLAGSSLSPADQLLIGAILQSAESRIKERLGPGPLDESQRISLLTLLSWVEEAAWSS